MSSSSLTRMDTAFDDDREDDGEFGEILQRALVGEDLSVEEGERLLQANDRELEMLASAADKVRQRRVGDVVTYVENRNINFTNICVGTCKFCAFRRSLGDPDAYLLTLEQIAAKVRQAVEFGATEVCIQGGLHPDFRLENYIEILEVIREVSKKIHIHAFSPAELNHAAKASGLSVEEVIKVLRDAGQNSVPGTAAEILVDSVRNIICPRKISTETWLEIIKSCHNLDLPTSATMMYGHVETPRDRAEHLVLLRELQDETKGFTEFVPLGFMCQNTQLQRMGVPQIRNGADDIRIHACARLILNNFDNIQASWVKLGPDLAQIMLNAGANDLSGTLMEENISRSAGGQRSKMPPEKIESLITNAGRIPRQRTTTYKLI